MNKIKKIISKKLVQLMLLALPSILITMLLRSYFYAGDEFAYKRFYVNAPLKSIVDAYHYFFSILSTYEPAYFLVVYVFSHFISKLVFDILLNFTLTVLVFSFFKKYKAHTQYYFFYYLNFYVLVLFFSADRLKLSMIFLLIAFLLKHEKRMLALVIPLLAQFQSAVLVSSYAIVEIKNNFKKEIITKRFLISSFLIGLVFLAVFYFLFDHIILKLQNFVRHGGIRNVVKPVIFLLFAFFLKKERWNYVVAGVPILFACYLVGSDRIVIFAYFLWMFFLIKENKKNILTDGMNYYFLLKGAGFIYSGYMVGDGFRVPLMQFLNMVFISAKSLL